MLLYLNQRGLGIENSLSAAKPHAGSDFWETEVFKAAGDSCAVWPEGNVTYVPNILSQCPDSVHVH